MWCALTAHPPLSLHVPSLSASLTLLCFLIWCSNIETRSEKGHQSSSCCFWCVFSHLKQQLYFRTRASDVCSGFVPLELSRGFSVLRSTRLIGLSNCYRFQQQELKYVVEESYLGFSSCLLPLQRRLKNQQIFGLWLLTKTLFINLNGNFKDSPTNIC